METVCLVVFGDGFGSLHPATNLICFMWARVNTFPSNVEMEEIKLR